MKGRRETVRGGQTRTGWWNEVFDGTGFFYALEKKIYDATGVAPRCWSEDEDFAVQEDAPEGWGDGIL